MRLIVALICLAALAVSGFAIGRSRVGCGVPSGITPVEWEVETVAEGLKSPWALALPADGRIYFTERVGRLSVIDSAGAKPRLLARIPDVAVGTGLNYVAGLLGFALDPAFPAEPYFYLYYTYAEKGALFNRLVRYRLQGDSAVPDRVLMDGIPGSPWENGGRVAFGRDGKLYLSTGGSIGGPQIGSSGAVRGRDYDAQNLNSVLGKILRLERDGTVPADNPFPGSPVYSYGFRNSQGLAWHPVTGALYSTEHGPPGGWDELNRLEAGRNYGWPIFKGNTASLKVNAIRFQSPKQWNVRPVAIFTPAIAPSGAGFYDGRRFPQWTNSLFIATLAGSHLHRIELTPDGYGVACEERLLTHGYGRIRFVVEGPDGYLYFTTTNQDYPQTAKAYDDRILRIVPRKSPH